MENYEQKYKEALEIAKKNYFTAQDLYDGSQIGVECFKNTLKHIFPELKENDNVEKPNGGIVLEDFNEGDGFYKVNLAYLNKKQVEEIEKMIKTWNKDIKTSNNDIINCIGMCKASNRT